MSWYDDEFAKLPTWSLEALIINLGDCWRFYTSNPPEGGHWRERIDQLCAELGRRGDYVLAESGHPSAGAVSLDFVERCPVCNGQWWLSKRRSRCTACDHGYVRK